MNVTFDKIETYTFEIKASAPNLTFADGCVLDEENSACTPSTIDVTGPQQQLNRRAYCVAETQQKGAAECFQNSDHRYAALL